MQIKLGCDFGRESVSGVETFDASIWTGQYTLWFNVVQYLSTVGTNDGNEDTNVDALPWTGTVSGTDSWAAALPKPSPYMFIYSTATCKQDDSTGGDVDEQLGMRWGAGASVVAPQEDQEAVKNKEEVISLIGENTLGLTELMNENIAKVEEAARVKTDDAEKNSRKAEGIAIVALFLSCSVLTVFFTLLGVRVVKPSEFRRALLAGDSAAVQKADWDEMSESDNQL